MQVTCSKCQTVYRFDKSEVNDQVVRMKCSHCGNLFLVKLEKGKDIPTVISDDTEEAPEVWRIRKPDGSVLVCDSITSLQRWIVEGKVNKKDEITQDGHNWKKLGNMVEFASFFQVVGKTKKDSPASVNTGPLKAKPTPVRATKQNSRLKPAAYMEQNEKHSKGGRRAFLTFLLLAVLGGSGYLYYQNSPEEASQYYIKFRAFALMGLLIGFGMATAH